MSALSAHEGFAELVSRLVEAVPGVEQAVVAAVDGLLLAASDGSCADNAE